MTVGIDWNHQAMGWEGRISRDGTSQVEGAGFALLTHPGASTLLVVFCGVRKEPGYWLWNSLQDSPVHRLFVRDPSNQFYQSGIRGLGDDLLRSCAAIEQIASALGVERICCLGHSMGGHGAILYGSLIRAAVICACAPEVTLLRSGGRSIRSCSNPQVLVFHSLVGHLRSTAVPTAIIAGQEDLPVLRSAGEVCDLPYVQVTELVGFGHSIPDAIGQDRRRDMIGSVIAGCLPVVEGFRGHLHRNPALLDRIGLATQMAGRDEYAAALQILTQAWQEHPEESGIGLRIAHNLYRSNEPDAALDVLRGLLGRVPASASVLSLHGLILAKLGDSQKAEGLLRKAFERDRRSEETGVELAKNLQAKGDPESAIAILDTVLLSHPESTTAKRLKQSIEQTWSGDSASLLTRKRERPVC